MKALLVAVPYLALFPTPESRAGDAPPPVGYKTVEGYKRNIAGGDKVSVWLGRRTALVIDGELEPEKRDGEVMTEIVGVFDEVFDAYERITGVKPKATRQFEGRALVEVSDKVGGGLAHHGRLGIAVGDGFFEGLYRRFKGGEKTLDQIYFYEIARNYWPSTFNPRIDYHTSKGVDDYGWWTVGFNNAMSIFLPAEIGGITDMYYFGSGGAKFAAGMERNLTAYLEGDYSWEEGWCINLVPWAERTSLNDLMTGLLVRLHRDNGGNEFIRKLYREIPKRRELRGRDDYQGARDNFYIAASLAASKDLRAFFAELRWEIGKEAKEEVAKALVR